MSKVSVPNRFSYTLQIYPWLLQYIFLLAILVLLLHQKYSCDHWRREGDSNPRSALPARPIGGNRNGKDDFKFFFGAHSLLHSLINNRLACATFAKDLLLVFHVRTDQRPKGIPNEYIQTGHSQESMTFPQSPENKPESHAPDH